MQHGQILSKRLFSAPKNRIALFSSWIYATTFFGLVDLLSIAPWYFEQYVLIFNPVVTQSSYTKFLRLFRILRILQLEGFIIAFSKLDNVYRASKDVLKATALMAIVVWVGCSALFFLFEENNPNWRICDSSIPAYGRPRKPGCYDFPTTAACDARYPGKCHQDGETIFLSFVMAQHFQPFSL